MKVICGPHGSINRLPVVSIEDSKITLAVLYPAFAVKGNENEEHWAGKTDMTWDEFVEWVKAPADYAEASGKPILPTNPVEVLNVPNQEGRFFLHGKQTLSLDGAYGYDELGDLAIMEFYVDSASRPKGIYNRLHQSKDAKAINPVRTRFIIGPDYAKGMSVVFPFAPSSSADAALIEVPYGAYKPILLDGEWDEERPAINAGSRLVDGLWRVEFDPNVTVAPDGLAEVSLQLLWNANEDYAWEGNTPCAKSVELTLSSNAGYLPKTKIKTDINGQAIVKVRAFDLTAGDRIKIKAQAGFHTKVGSTEIKVE
jgi:hypothetical protein